MQWTTEGKRRKARPKEIWRRMAEKELNEMAWKNWEGAPRAAADRQKWSDMCSTLCSTRSEEDKKNKTSVVLWHLQVSRHEYAIYLVYFKLPLHLQSVLSYFKHCTKSSVMFYIPFNSQGHVGTGPQLCHLWESNLHRGDCL